MAREVAVPPIVGFWAFKCSQPQLLLSLGLILPPPQLNLRATPANKACSSWVGLGYIPFWAKLMDCA
jgi:hypothetical protein